MTGTEGYHIHAAGRDDANAIAQLSGSEFGTAGVSKLSVERSIDCWRERRSPFIIAKNVDGVVVGFARSKPNEAQNLSRSQGQVAVFAQVAVALEARGKGIGQALMERSLTTLRMLDYSRVFAQMQPQLTKWYRERGWRVLPSGRSIAWVEPWIPQDDEWNEHLPSGSFAPLLLMYHLPAYPNLGEFRLAEAQPLLEVDFDAVGDDTSTMRRVYKAVGAAIVANPTCADKLPWALAKMLSEENAISRSAAEVLMRRASADDGPNSS